MMEGSEVVHEDGRTCIYRNGEWLWDGVNGETYKVCEYEDHPGGDRDDLDVEDSSLISEAFKASPGRIFPMPEVTLMPRLVINEDGITVDYGEQGYTVPAVTEDARYILKIMPDILTQFLEKNAKYRSVEDGYDLGDQGIIPDLNRKLGILVDRIWHGNREHIGESTDEVIGDLIGHLFLMLAKRRDQ